MHLHNLDNSFLARYRPPALSFPDVDGLPEPLQPIWSALRTNDFRPALRRGYEILREKAIEDDVRAALLGGLASAEWDSGDARGARRTAKESIALYESQWLAHRVLLTTHLAENDFEAACRVLGSIAAPDEFAIWDEPLSSTDQQLLRAACAWMTHDWDGTADRLTDAYPDGVNSMPAVLQEDWLRLAFYRKNPDDAAAAARQLMHEHSPERADILIQTLVQQGWHKEALALYRSIYDQDPTNELLRRRIVGLCIREGEVQEARRLMQLGALWLAV